MSSSAKKSYGFFLNNERASVAIREQEERNSEYAAKIIEQQQAAARRQSAYESFISESRDFLLTESLFSLYKKCMPEGMNESLLNRGKAVISSFVIEEGSKKLLDSFSTKTLFLSELADVVNSTHKKVLHDCDEKVEPFKISASTFKDFHGKLDTLDTDEITKAITQRVAMAEEKMVQDNIKDKKKMEDLASKTKEKLDKVKASSDEAEKEVKQEHTALYRQAIDNQVVFRRKSILEGMVNRMASQVATSNMPEFTNKNGKLDMDRIIENCEAMYGVLEMLNTIKAKEFTPEYISEVMDSLK